MTVGDGRLGGRANELLRGRSARVSVEIDETDASASSRPEQCREYLENRIAEAKSPQEVLELLGDAIIAAEFADQREVAQSHRIQFWSRAVGEAAGHELAADVTEVKIKRPARS